MHALNMHLQKRQDQKEHVEGALLIPAPHGKDQLYHDVDQQYKINSQKCNLHRIARDENT